MSAKSRGPPGRRSIRVGRTPPICAPCRNSRRSSDLELCRKHTSVKRPNELAAYSIFRRERKIQAEFPLGSAGRLISALDEIISVNRLTHAQLTRFSLARPGRSIGFYLSSARVT